MSPLEHTQSETAVPGDSDKSSARQIAAGKGKVLLLTPDRSDWLKDNASSLRTFLSEGGAILAAGLSEKDGKALALASGAEFTVARKTLWINPLSGPLPTAFRGVSPAAIHWRRKLEVTTIATVHDKGWRSDTGILATVPVGSGEIIWIATTPDDFNPEERPDLIFTSVNTKRLYTIVLNNLGVHTGAQWSSFLGSRTTPDDTKFYNDKRIPRDDPYAYMRW
ncbi:MAG: hypothetical protein R6V06_08960 [Kiritimatiellia bacterium]